MYIYKNLVHIHEIVSATNLRNMTNIDSEVLEYTPLFMTYFQIIAPRYINPVFAESVSTCGAWTCCADCVL